MDVLNEEDLTFIEPIKPNWADRSRKMVLIDKLWASLKNDTTR